MTPARPRKSSPPDDASPRASEASTPNGPGWPGRLSIVLFAGSGCAALIYEIIWFQLLELVVGSSAISLGILLATYMGGMCLGSVLLPRVVSVRHHPFRVYALLELGIAVLAILVFFFVPLVGRMYTGSGAQGLGGVFVRAAIAGLCLLPPTILMGATLPAIARWVESTPVGAGRLGLLYAGNIAGGIAGCLLAGFYLLRVFDMATATGVAALVNVAVSLVAFQVAARTGPRAPAPRPAPAPLPQAARGGIYLTIAISGLCALGGEVAWTRILALLLGGTVYTFSIILAVYLLGLGIGSTVGSALARSSPRPGRDLGLCQVLLTAAVAWSAFVLCRSLPYWPIAPSLARSPWMSFQLDLVRCLWAILPATLLWGASFPLALAAAAERGQDPGRLVARVYAANTLGAIAGALGFTLWIIPGFGTQGAQRTLVALSGTAGLVMLAPAAWSPGKRAANTARAGLLLAAALLAAWLTSGVPPVPGTLIALGRYVAFRQDVRNERTNARYDDPNILYVGEGLTESVVVSDNGHIRLFHVSGKVEATTAGKDMRLQRMLGHIPALVHPHPRSVLIVGFGAGVTAGSFVLYPGVERIVICEIEPLVTGKVAPFFRNENYDVLSDPRVEVVYDDARHYVLTTREKFDVITSDPIHPWVKGSGALYSRDYFDLVRRHLNPGGVVTQWVPLYQASEPTVKGEIATFFAAFPNGTIWANLDRGQGYDLVLLGTDGPTTIDLDALDERVKRPDHLNVARSLQAVGFPSVIDLMATYAGRRDDLAPWLAGAEINRDRKPWLQYRAGMESYTEQKADTYAAMAAYRRFPEELFLGSEKLKQELRAGGGADRAGP